MKSTSDPASDLAIPKTSTCDYEVTVQYNETSCDSGSSSYDLEERRIPSNMGNEKPMELLQ